MDLYALRNYPAAEVRAYGERVLGYIKNVLKADAVGIVWNFYARDRYSAELGRPARRCLPAMSAS